jgi:large subunit ribosomal protein L4
VAAPKAPLLDAAGKKSKDVVLDEGVFAVELKPHLVHETVVAERNSARSGTKAAKTRGLVSGGRAKPWRQKGTGRARQGTTRAAQFAGGGVVFAGQPRSWDAKVNKKVRKAALRGVLSDHASRGTLAVVDGSAFGDEPSTQKAVSFLGAWEVERPLLIVAEPEEGSFVKSFRNLPKVRVIQASELEVGALVWARSLLVSQAALERVQRQGNGGAERES